MTWLRHRIYRWLFDLGGPIMSRVGHHWIYADPQGNLWRVDPTYDEIVPLRISMLVRR